MNALDTPPAADDGPISAPGTPPRGAGKVGQIRYPKGHIAGTGAVNIYSSPQFSDSGSWKRMYVDLDFQMSSNWSGHATGTLKLLMPRHDIEGVTNRIIVSPQGAALDPLRTGVGSQGTVIPPNSTPYALGTPTESATVNRGSWVRWECLFENNSPGQADGRVRIWQNGTLVLDKGGYEFVPGLHNWQNLSINPTYGGTGGTVPHLQFIWLGYLYVSLSSTPFARTHSSKGQAIAFLPPRSDQGADSCNQIERLTGQYGAVSPGFFRPAAATTLAPGHLDVARPPRAALRPRTRLQCSGLTRRATPL